MKYKNDLRVDLNGLKLKNPVTVASGTFGFGREYAEFVDLNEIGAISVKGLTLKERLGNPGIRIVETPSGMLNSVGLQNPGIEYFIENEIPFLRRFDTKIIANINGHTEDEYVEMAKICNGADVDSVELNISCPNVAAGGLAFGTDVKNVYNITRKIKKVLDKHLIVKLTPNVTDIKEIAKAAEEGGADCISLINTVTGAAIDINKRKFILDRKFGGLSGPCVKPIAIKLVHDVKNTVRIPVIGMGGISNYEDVIEFILAGANAVSIGTYNFIDPRISTNVLKGIDDYLSKHSISKISDLKLI